MCRHGCLNRGKDICGSLRLLAGKARVCFHRARNTREKSRIEALLLDVPVLNERQSENSVRSLFTTYIVDLTLRLHRCPDGSR